MPGPNTRAIVFGLSCILAGTALHAQAEEPPTRPTLNTYGAPGLIEMPSGRAEENGQLSLSLGYQATGTLRTTGTFQVLPRLSGSFRYSSIADWSGPGKRLLDRSFDIRYLIRRESARLPAVTVGIQDFMGTGIYSAEYIAATKSLTPRLTVTGGIGWGRLGSHGSFRNPLALIFPGFAKRPTGTSGLGGLPEINRWFRGPAALFGGIEYRAGPRLTLKAELSSDAYSQEVAKGIYTHNSPINIGFDWQATRSLSVAGYYLNGSTAAIRASITFNPRHPAFAGPLHPAPAPVIPRPAPTIDPAAWGTEWTAQPDGPQILTGNLGILLARDGMEMVALNVTADTAHVWIRNRTHDAEPEAIGRVARLMTAVMPASVETFVITPMVEGLPTTSIRLRRSDLEALETAPHGTAEMLQRTTFDSAGYWPDTATVSPQAYPSWLWSISPFIGLGIFDPDNPARADFGLKLEARYEPRPGLVFSTEIRKRALGNINTVTRVSDSVVRHVRSDYRFYDVQGDPAIYHLTMEKFFRPGRNLYGRVTVGYLERMYGGVSAEVLWKRPDSPFALGLEVNATKQRAYNQLFGFRSYGVVTGHASAYWELGNGFHAQIDAGRYLLGDYGATFSLDREFANGWKLGGFFTLTTLPVSKFGEGSFDKGIRISIPMSWFTGRPTRKVNDTTIRPVTRDGGARLEVRNRLYGLVRDYHRPSMRREWGRFWR